MAADTITIGGKSYPKKYVIAAGAATLGIVAYAWWRNAGAVGDAAQPDPIEDTVDGGFLGDEPQGGGSAGYQGGDFDQADDGAIHNNADWSRRALEILVEQGYEGAAVSAALGRFLARLTLTKTEATIVRAALAVTGNPPQGQPWTVIEEGTTATPGLTTPSNLRATAKGPTSITWAWNSQAGVTGYQYEVIQGEGTVIKSGTVEGTSYTATGLTPDRPYRIGVRARNSGGTVSGRATRVDRTAAAPATPATPAAKLSKPKAIRISANRTDMTATWQVVPGAKAYAWSLIAGRNTRVDGGLTPTNRASANVPLTPGRPYRFIIQAIDHQNKLGPRATAVGRTDR